jgi:hypothetical protein
MFTRKAKVSLPDVGGIMHMKMYKPKSNVIKRSDPYKVLKAVIAAGAIALAATYFYAIRDLLAALLIFSVLFAVVGTALLILILLQEAALWGVTQVESHWTNVRARYVAAAAKRLCVAQTSVCAVFAERSANQNHTG